MGVAHTDTPPQPRRRAPLADRVRLDAGGRVTGVDERFLANSIRASSPAIARACRRRWAHRRWRPRCAFCLPVPQAFSTWAKGQAWGDGGVGGGRGGERTRESKWGERASERASEWASDGGREQLAAAGVASGRQCTAARDVREWRWACCGRASQLCIGLRVPRFSPTSERQSTRRTRKARERVAQLYAGTISMAVIAREP